MGKKIKIVNTTLSAIIFVITLILVFVIGVEYNGPEGSTAHYVGLNGNNSFDTMDQNRGWGYTHPGTQYGLFGAAIGLILMSFISLVFVTSKWFIKGKTSTKVMNLIVGLNIGMVVVCGLICAAYVSSYTGYVKADVSVNVGYSIAWWLLGVIIPAAALATYIILNKKVQ